MKQYFCQMESKENKEISQPDSLKEKRKWQIAMRRYILEKQPSAQYAAYFGISIEGFRSWIALQFGENLNWDNFGKQWQLEHIIPAQYFNLQDEEDLKLCWNFLNIRVKNEDGPSTLEVTGFAAIQYFEEISALTQWEIAGKMVQKLQALQKHQLPQHVHGFLLEHKLPIHKMGELDANSLLRINQGELLENILLEQSIMQKFGA